MPPKKNPKNENEDVVIEIPDLKKFEMNLIEDEAVCLMLGKRRTVCIFFCWNR